MRRWCFSWATAPPHWLLPRRPSHNAVVCLPLGLCRDRAVLRRPLATHCGLPATKLDVSYRHELALSSVLSVVVCRVPHVGTNHESLHAGQAVPCWHNCLTALAPPSHVVHRFHAFSRTRSSGRIRELLIPALRSARIANALSRVCFGPKDWPIAVWGAPIIFHHFSYVFNFLFCFCFASIIFFGFQKRFQISKQFTSLNKNHD